MARCWAWILENYLLEDRLDITFLEGGENKLADTLSRWIVEERIGPVAMEDVDDEILERHAEYGHFGAQKTWDSLRRRGHIQYTLTQVEKAVRRCWICARFRRKKIPASFGHIDDPMTPGEFISLDVIGPLATSVGNFKYILTCIDHLTRLGGAYPLRTPSARAILSKLEQWIDEKRWPLKLLVDSASYFYSQEFRGWAAEHGIELIYAPPYAHQCMGLIERFNQTIIGRLRRFILEAGGSENSWKSHLDRAIKVISEAVNDDTKYIPLEAWNQPLTWPIIRHHIAVARQTANRRRRSREPVFEVDDLVYLYDSLRAKQLNLKFSPYWVGPFLISNRLSRVIYELKDFAELLPSGSSKRLQVHSDFLQEYV